MKKNKRQIKEEVMKKIECGGIKMKPRGWFLAQKILLLGLLFTCILLTAFVVALLDYWFVRVFWQKIPIYWLFLLVFVVIFGYKIYGRCGDNYKIDRSKKLVMWLSFLLLFSICSLVLERFFLVQK